MKRPSLAALAAFATLAPALSANAQSQVNDAPLVFNPAALEIFAPHIRCELYLGIHIALQNMGLLPIAAGTVIHWSLEGGAAGNYLLPATLAPQDAALIEFALPFAPRGNPVCTASIPES